MEAVNDGAEAVAAEAAQYEIVGLKGKDADNTYGLAEKITMDKQDFQGIRAAYEFDPTAEKYIPVDPMKEARWYPTLVGLEDGRVLAVSGLDDVGAIVPGDNEIYDPRTKKWSQGPLPLLPDLPRALPHQGRQALLPGRQRRLRPGRPRAATPGIWDLKTNTFTEGARA